MLHAQRRSRNRSHHAARPRCRHAVVLAVLESLARLDVGSILNAAGVTREQLHDPDLRLPAARADALWRAAYELAEDPFLALHAAQALPCGAYTGVSGPAPRANSAAICAWRA